MEKLATLAMDSVPETATVAPGSTCEATVEESLGAIRGMDARRLEEVLTHGIVSLGQHGLIEKVVAPVAEKLGALWREGAITAAHEHFASAALRSFLERNSRPFTVHANTATMIATTPAGQLHELGAAIAAAAASDLGWRVIYLGPSLPAADIAGAAIQNQARAVAISIVYPEDDPALPGELENLRQFLPSTTAIIAGGRAAGAYGPVFRKIGAHHAKNLRSFYDLLETLRRPMPVAVVTNEGN